MGSTIPVYPFAEFRSGRARPPQQRYAVVLSFDLAKGSVNGYGSFEALKQVAGPALFPGTVPAASAG